MAAIPSLLIAGILLSQNIPLPPPALGETNRPAVDEILFNGLGFDPQITREELIGMFGTPTAVYPREGGNGTTITSFFFGGLMVELFESPTTSVAIGAIWKESPPVLPARIRPGQSRQDILALLGPPDVELPDARHIYGSPNARFGEQVEFGLEAGRIVEILWKFYRE